MSEDLITEVTTEEVKTKRVNESAKLTAKQLAVKLEQLKKQQARELEKIEKQVKKAEEVEQNSIKRKLRNKKIYNVGGLAPFALGVDNFDKVCDSQDFKNFVVGVLLEYKRILDNQTASRSFVNDYIKDGQQYFSDLAK